MKNLIFIIPFIVHPKENGNTRFIPIVEKLTKEYNVEIIYSSFSHNDKIQRHYKNEKINGVKYTIIFSPSYKKNISLKRFYAHYIFSKNVKKYLNSLNNIDKIYCAVPDFNVGKVCADYAKDKNVEFIVDIQDIWPEAFKLIYDNKMIDFLIYSKMRKIAQYVYSSANKIIAVSQTYLNLGLSSSNAIGLVSYLGTSLDVFDDITEKIDKKNEIWLTYIGTIGASYNIEICIRSVAELNKSGFPNLKFICIGDGPDLETHKLLANKLNCNCDFKGRLPYKEMCLYLKNSDIAANVIKDNAAQSITNKICDYAGAGVCVINTQKCIEYKKIVDEYKIGINSKNEITSFVNDLKFLLMNKEKIKIYGNNNYKLAREKFDKNKNNKIIVDFINK